LERKIDTSLTKKLENSELPFLLLRPSEILVEALIQFFSSFVNNHQKRRRNWSFLKLEVAASTDHPPRSSRAVQSNALLARCTWMSQRMVAQ
jgi:hypothetical protein